jgi:hypothetical protein
MQPVGVRIIHNWLRYNYPKTGVCENCGEEGKTEYAFKRHPKPHTRNRKDYMELCRLCHVRLDGGHGAAKTNREKTHCPRGHAYSGENLIERKSGRRGCRACTKIHKQAHRQRNH